MESIRPERPNSGQVATNGFVAEVQGASNLSDLFKPATTISPTNLHIVSQ
jgi:hypothetical protein